MLNRRHQPKLPSNPTIVLDDTDRLNVPVWVALGPRTEANRRRHAMKALLNHPCIVAYGVDTPPPGHAPASPSRGGVTAGLPTQIELQSVRSIDVSGQRLLVRLRHVYATGEDAVLSVPVQVSVAVLWCCVLLCIICAEYMQCCFMQYTLLCVHLG